MGSPINQAPLTAVKTNLVNGEVSDAPLLEEAIENLYVYVDEKNAEINAHTAATTLPHADGSVTNSKIRDGAVTEPKLATGAVSTNKLAENSIITSKIQNNQITESKLGSGSVSSRAIANQAVKAQHIDPGVFAPYPDSAVWVKFADVDAQLAETDQQVTVLNSASVLVDSFPIIPPESNDTGRVQRAIDSITSGVIVFPYDKTLVISTLVISNKTDFRITGGKLQLTGNGARAFNLIGTIDGLEIDHMMIKGDGLSASGQSGITNDSNQTITNINYHENLIIDVIIGISLNADLGGTYDKGRVAKNTLINIVGVNASQGYGIHLANATRITVTENLIDRCQRHSIYQAKGGKGVIISKNTISNHRMGVATEDFRPALYIARSEDVLVDSNVVSDFYDGGILVSGDSGNGFPCKNITVSNNFLLYQKNSPASICCGEQTEATALVEGVKFVNNTIVATGGGIIAKFFNGKQIEFAYNKISLINVVGTGFAMEFSDSFVASTAQADELSVHDNQFDFQGTSFGSSRAIHVGADYCTGSIKLDIRNNVYFNKANYTDIVFGAAVTNANLTYARKSISDNRANTSGATLAALETEVNELKNRLRELGLMKNL